MTSEKKAQEIKALLWLLAEGGLHLKRLLDRGQATIRDTAVLVRTTRGLSERLAHLCTEYEMLAFEEMLADENLAIEEKKQHDEISD